jgi:hypothetical protein
MAKVIQIETQIDVTAPKVVQVVVREDGKTIWVNVDGVCKFRACQIGKLIVDDQRKKKRSGYSTRITQ